MPDADVALTPTTPWTLRLFARARVSPIWVGLGMSAVWFALYLLYATVLVDGPDRFWPSELGWSLLIGMAPAVTAASMRGSARDLEDLAPALRVSPAELEGLRREIATVPRARLTAVGVGTVVLTAAAVFHESIMDVGRFAALNDSAMVWYLGRNAVNFWLISRALTIELSLARTFSRLGARLPAVDVVDRTPLAPFGRRGLRSVLLWMLYLSLFSWQYALGAARPELVAVLLIVVSIAVAAFLLPVWGAHLRLREAKATELSRVRMRDRRAPGACAHGAARKRRRRPPGGPRLLGAAHSVGQRVAVQRLHGVALRALHRHWPGLVARRRLCRAPAQW